MGRPHTAYIVLGALCIFSFLVALCSACCYFCSLRRRRWRTSSPNTGSAAGPGADVASDSSDESEDLIWFPGGEGLTAHDILEAPGEVVGKSGYGTLYRATIHRTGKAALLRFVRPGCTGRTRDVLPAVRAIGYARHPNLVPLCALYVGARGEKLLVYPFYAAGNLSRFLRDGNAESHRWEVIHKHSLGIARGLEYLHCLQRPVIHGNLKTKNVLLDANNQPRLSDFGIHLLLNSTAAQEMLESSASEGYKAPELIKMKEASRETDIYSFGIILLEMVTRKPIKANSHDPHPPPPVSLRTLLLENKLSDAVNESRDESSSKEGLLMFFQLAMACCSPSPALRPDIKQVVRKLEEIGRG